MSVLHMESFIAFGAVNGNDDNNTTVNAARKEHTAALRRAGYQLSVGRANVQNDVNAWMIRPDPVNPERNALVGSFGAFDLNGNTSAIRKKLPTLTGEPIIGGFSLFIPNEYTKATAPTSNPVLRVHATSGEDTGWWNDGSDFATTVREVFRIGQDLQVRWTDNAPQSQKALIPGRLAFIEYRISNTDIRVWIDDVLVMQKTMAMNVEYIGFTLVQWGAAPGAPTPVGSAMRWAIGNWYNLIEDAVAPNVRLGPTTRVIGVRPNEDVSTMFQRPTGYASNAAVVAQNLVDAPVATLQSVAVGDQDVYRSTTDTATAGGKMIHAVGVKVLASNLEASPHTIRPLLRASNGTQSPTTRSREWRATDVISPRKIFAIARRPTDGKIFAFGAAGAMYMNANDGAPGTPWTQMQADGAAFDITCVAFRADGWGLVGRSDGRMQPMSPLKDTLEPSFTTSGMISCRCAIALPSGRIIIGGDAARIAVGPTTAEGNPGETSKVIGRLLGDDNGAFMQFAFAPNLGTGQGRLFCITNRTQGYPNSMRSDDQGTTWAGVYNGTNVDWSAAVWDSNSNVFIIAISHIAGGTRRSIDGMTFTMPPATSSTLGMTSQRMHYGFYDADAKQTIFIGDLGNMMVSPNGNEWRAIPRVTDKQLRCIMKLPNGDYLACGDTGQLVHYTAGQVDGYMAPLGGYVQYTNFAAVNPVTGAAWTPAEASASQFGMRLTS